MLEPLEQFNILMFMYSKHCTYSGYYLDNVSYTLFNSLMLFIFFSSIFLFQTKDTFKVDKKDEYVYFHFFFIRILKELKGIVSSNMVLQKPIFLLYLIFLFLFVFWANIFGMICFNSTVTSYFVVTFSLSLITFLSITLVGIYYNRFGFLKILLPKGVPIYLVSFLIIIELISYCSRVVSLAIRLFANMMSGHTLLKILLGFYWSFITGGYTSYIMGIIPLAVIFCIVFIECMIAFLQAYIFMVLSSIYFNDVINIH